MCSVDAGYVHLDRALINMTTSAPITERDIRHSFCYHLFFLWALGVNLIFLIPHLKKVFDLNDFQSALIQVHSFGGYCLPRCRQDGCWKGSATRMESWLV